MFLNDFIKKMTIFQLKQVDTNFNKIFLMFYGQNEIILPSLFQRMC